MAWRSELRDLAPLILARIEIFSFRLLQNKYAEEYAVQTNTGANPRDAVQFNAVH